MYYLSKVLLVCYTAERKISLSQCISCSLNGLQVVPTSVAGLKKKFLAMECQQHWACVHGIAWFWFVDITGFPLHNLQRNQQHLLQFLHE